MNATRVLLACQGVDAHVEQVDERKARRRDPDACSLLTGPEYGLALRRRMAAAAAVTGSTQP